MTAWPPPNPLVGHFLKFEDPLKYSEYGSITGVTIHGILVIGDSSNFQTRLILHRRTQRIRAKQQKSTHP